MRYKKKELIQMVSALEEANQTFVQAAAAEPSMLVELLVQCQNIAIEIGTYLETKQHISESIVKILEEYCENLYQQSISLNDCALLGQLCRNIQKQLSQISRAIQDFVPEDKKVIVFLPYKASMWDSLESVWAVARDDKNCESYVIPIPYYEKNPDGTLGAMHYEGNDYPDYVPVTDWREYSLAEHRPDIIYIHNPYDEYNLITSVHPAFYSKELKKYTDMLVYIPYFIAINDKVEEQLCTTCGVLYADKVIVESEAVRKIYLDQLHQMERENHCKDVFGNVDEKIIALGSPKLDRVRGMNREDVRMPETWKGRIYGPDGSRKKVILYNTTINALLNHSDRVLDKIESVLRIFKEEENIVLLWRPHPLLMSTIRSMRMVLYERYQDIVGRYREENWGIYDDTPDVERAITVSDAYYGDMSSVVELYKATGKPVMIQNYDVIL